MLDAWKDENFRQTAATLSAHRFLIELMLSNLFDRHREDADNISTILRLANQTGHLTAADDASAEFLADVAVRMQQLIAESVARARQMAGIERSSGQDVVR